MKPNQLGKIFKSAGFPYLNNIGTNLTSKERENFVLIIGLASWAGAATFGLLAALALLAYIAKRREAGNIASRRETGNLARRETGNIASRRETGKREREPEFVICTREERGAEVTRL